MTNAPAISQHAEMSRRTALTVLTVLTVLTLVARFDSELILIDSFPPAPRGRRITSHEKEGCAPIRNLDVRKGDLSLAHV